jgi:molecular chaperone IbpA
VVVKGAKLENGLLHVDLVRELPEAMKPRTIPIETKVEKPRVIDSKAA